MEATYMGLTSLEQGQLHIKKWSKQVILLLEKFLTLYRKNYNNL